MKTQELESYLKEKGFTEGSLDSGCNYIYDAGHIELICYVETGIEVEFLTIYRWNNNDVKGTYNIPVAELERTKDSVETMFRKTKNNLPQRIGETIDTHQAAEEVFEKVFQ